MALGTYEPLLWSKKLLTQGSRSIEACRTATSLFFHVQRAESWLVQRTRSHLAINNMRADCHRRETCDVTGNG